MWEDIRKWIVYLYLTTGLIFGIVTPSLAGIETIGRLVHLLYIILCVFAWLPIIIISWMFYGMQ